MFHCIHLCGNGVCLIVGNPAFLGLTWMRILVRRLMILEMYQQFLCSGFLVSSCSFRHQNMTLYLPLARSLGSEVCQPTVNTSHASQYAVLPGADFYNEDFVS